MDILTQKQTAELETKLGKIEVQTPSLRKKLDIAKRRSFYASGLTVMGAEGADLAEHFATLDVIMTTCKALTRVENDVTSWDYDKIYDEDAIKDAYDKAVEWLDSFRKPVAAEQA
jgi:hypothetical protein